jgi:hypothetical protein
MPCRLAVVANVSEKFAVSIFRAEVMMLGSGRGKVEGPFLSLPFL